MADLATLDQLGSYMGINPEPTRASELLAQASKTVRTYTGQNFDLVTDDVERVKVRGRIARVTQRPVAEVSAVADMSGNPVPFTWYQGDRIDLAPVPDSWSFQPWTTGVSTYVDVTYTHGYELVPDDVVAVICSIVARALGVTPDATGIQSETLGPYSYTLGTAAAAGPVGMLQAERDALAPYTQVGGMVAL